MEKRVLSTLLSITSGDVQQLAQSSKIDVDQARRAIEWLRTKELVSVKSTTLTSYSLGSIGKKVVADELPERRLIDFLKRKGGRATMKELSSHYQDNQGEFSAAVSYSQKREWTKRTIVDSTAGLEVASYSLGELPEESILKKLSKAPMQSGSMTSQEEEIISTLVKRPNYIDVKDSSSMIVELTRMGREAAKNAVTHADIDNLTPELLVSGEWKNHTFTHLDVEAPTSSQPIGKKHPFQIFIDEVRETFVSLGFEEILGPIVQSCFWNFDALFIPQDHPARDMQDTFYVSEAKADLSNFVNFSKEVSKVHKDGGATGSKGWGYEWRQENAEGVVLRTHTTPVTVRFLAQNRPDEARVFSVGRVFRNEKVTYKNLVEFHQIEGIAVGRDVNLRNMMGLLGKFYSKLGFKKVKFWPTYFPYTEPSIQSMVYFEKTSKWVELCGMGIFRPEVTIPLGVKNPVLAWGGGLERLAMLRLGLDDARTLYENDLGWLRGAQFCQS
ncbi:MAG: phenylalanine--tRNA ligase subunit alpha [Thaumarchaeota archaeon]|nr:phenylalanine--tRNA ligase subunit alpha [Nitrososphaerota archaeon]